MDPLGWITGPKLPKPVANSGPVERPAEYPDWGALTADSQLWPLRRPGNRGRVLIATNIGGHAPAAMFESTLAAALAIRDADVEIVLCDGVLPACLKAEYGAGHAPEILIDRKLPESLCPGCLGAGRAMFEPLGLKVHYLSELVTGAERKTVAKLACQVSAGEIATYEYDGLKVGEQARAGALRYYARGDLDGEPQGEMVLRRYLEGAILTAIAYRRLLDDNRYDVAVFHHGLYVPQGVIGEVCREKGVHVVNWFVAYREGCFIASHGDTYHHTLMEEPAEAWETMTWGDIQRGEIEAYLKSSWQGSRDWIGFHEQPSEDAAAWLAGMGVDPDKPIVGLLTNVVWDAQLHYPANAFDSLIEWTLETIDAFAARPDLQLVIRIHPAEIRGTARSRQPMAQVIAERRPDLPANVFIIGPADDVSTYAVMEHCNSVLIYGTKTGVELAAMGVPVIVAGEAWIKGKGLTLDAETRGEYAALLATLPLPGRLDARTVEQAKKYAYHFFFRRMMPLKIMRRDASSLFFRPAIASVDDLASGADEGLDRLCEGVLTGSPFIYPAEEIGL
jgi:hypothetical protein